jgi:hypothetical protein
MNLLLHSVSLAIAGVAPNWIAFSSCSYQVSSFPALHGGELSSSRSSYFLDSSWLLLLIACTF